MKLYIVTGALLLFIAGCGDARKDDIVARSGQLQLTRDEVLASISYSSPEDSLIVSAIYIEDWKSLALLYQLALEENIDKDPGTKRLIEKAKRTIVVQRFVDKRMEKAENDGLHAIDSSAAREFYHQFPEMFTASNKEYAVSRYYASTAQSASRIENALRLHEDDENRLLELIESIEPGYAAENRQARDSVRELKTLDRIHLENDTMKEALQKLAPGELSSVIAVDDSLFVVLELHDIVGKGEKKTFEQSYGDIEELLTVQKQKQYYSTLLEEARKKYQ
ncbi:MAG: hypothetical protein MI685_11705 [Chlorobiales bacterium]|nr:hypothetical protein [Chlorobiales bacterium]